MSNKKPKNVGRCSECDARITFHNQPKQWDSVTCPECRTSLQVISLSPLELYWVMEDAYDNYLDNNYYEDDDYMDYNI